MMIRGEDGQIQCSKCTGTDIKNHVHVDDGKGYEMLTCQTSNCGHTTNELISVTGERMGNNQLS